jgi:predicted RND superfamily exporter protein
MEETKVGPIAAATGGFGALMLSRLNVLWSMGLGGVVVVAASVLAEESPSS